MHRILALYDTPPADEQVICLDERIADMAALMAFGERPAPTTGPQQCGAPSQPIAGAGGR
ncbi:hypothetical protein [Streptomyces sp. NPDC055134]